MTRVIWISWAIAFAAAQPVAARNAQVDPQAGAGFSEKDFARHVRTLASDEFEGREPSSPGEEKTVRYIRDELAGDGLQPGAPDGTWFQEVPLVKITADPGAELTLEGTDRTLELDYGQNMVVWTKRVTERAGIEDSELVFVGYGIVAPEYGWNDYEAVDVRGKTVVMLVNDPGFATRDPGLFTGNAMTWYGRWTYKFEEAARQGAAGAIIVHETAAAGYPWDVVTGSWTGPQFDSISSDKNLQRAAIEGWISRDAAERLFKLAGADYEQAKHAAARRGFRARPLSVTATAAVDNSLERSRSRNVVGRLPGRERPEECIIYMAHWDHLGRDETRDGDQIFNGALDNATGVAGILEIAEAFAALPRKPARSILFLAVTAEESGLLGSQWYASHPACPLADTVAAINIDRMSVFGRTEDVTVVGYGSSELEDWLERAASRQDRRLEPEPTPEKGFFYRSDHFNLARRGVPVLYTKSGVDHVERGEEYGRRLEAEYVADRYHKPGDEYDPHWDLSGTLEDMAMMFDVGLELANSEAFPNWHEDSEFRAAREASRAKSRDSRPGS
ncbi:M28 family metallopeptidase [soil metagenome]